MPVCINVSMFLAKLAHGETIRGVTVINSLDKAASFLNMEAYSDQDAAEF